METNINILSAIYNRVVPINDKYCIVNTRRRYGIADVNTGKTVLDIKYTEYYIYNDAGIVVLFDLMEAATIVFNNSTGKYIEIANLYKFSNSIGEAMFFHQVRTSSGMTRTMIIRRDTMRVLLEPTIVSVIEPVNSDGVLVRMKLFNSGYNIDNLFYSLTDQYKIKADGIG